MLVIGGSVAGLMTGCLLHRAGWDVAVFERAVGDLTGRGAGLGVSEERDGRIGFEHTRFMVASAWARCTSRCARRCRAVSTAKG